MFCLPPEVNKSVNLMMDLSDLTTYIESCFKYDWLMAKIVALFSSLFFTR